MLVLIDKARLAATVLSSDCKMKLPKNLAFAFTNNSLSTGSALIRFISLSISTTALSVTEFLTLVVTLNDELYQRAVPKLDLTP